MTTIRFLGKRRNNTNEQGEINEGKLEIFKLERDTKEEDFVAKRDSKAGINVRRSRQLNRLTRPVRFTSWISLNSNICKHKGYLCV